MRFVDQGVDLLLGLGVHAEGHQVQATCLLVEQAQHDALAVTRGHRRDTHVDSAAGNAQRNSAVLRQPFLRDVELRHDLDARDDQRRKCTARLQHLAQHAVDTKPDAEAVFVGLDVYVGGVLLDRFGQHRVDEPDDGRIVITLEEIRRFLQFLGNLRQVEILVEAIDHRGRIGSVLLVRLPQQRIENLGRNSRQFQRHARKAARLGETERRRTRAIHGFARAVAELADQDAMALRKRERQRPAFRRLFRCGFGRENDVGFDFHRVTDCLPRCRAVSDTPRSAAASVDPHRALAESSGPAGSAAPRGSCCTSRRSRERSAPRP